MQVESIELGLDDIFLKDAALTFSQGSDFFEAVFISDLHLHRENKVLQVRFDAFIEWIAFKTKALYILGDFFHAWAGDDSGSDWSESIASRLAALTRQGIKVFFMPGNRDFLLGKRFAKSANIVLLTDPSVLYLEGQKLVLSHGDRYCKQDRMHQLLIKITRNRVFIRLFLALPLGLRKAMVEGVRGYSLRNTPQKDPAIFKITLKSLIQHLKTLKVNTIIHGHIHQPKCCIHRVKTQAFKQFVLSDWDDKPAILIYNKSDGFKFLKFWS